MIRFSWLQFRAQVIVAVAGLLGAGLVLAVTGPHLARLYAVNVGGCPATADCAGIRDAFLAHDRTLRIWLGVLVVAVPGLAGLFWGAPLVAREVEMGTFRLVWTQSVTRTRWLTAKLGLAVLIGTVAVGLLSLAVTWWAYPLDRAQASRFSTFDMRDVVPVGYAAFALSLGAACGILIRRTLPALAVTLVLFVAARLGTTLWLRAHLLGARHSASVLRPSGIGYGRQSLTGGGNLFPDPPNLPNAWIISNRIVDSTGRSLTSQRLAAICPNLTIREPGPGSGASNVQVGDPQKQLLRGCVDKVAQSYHVLTTYQPANRYWPLQFCELGLYLAAATALAAFCLWAVRHRLS